MIFFMVCNYYYYYNQQIIGGLYNDSLYYSISYVNFLLYY